MTAQTFNVIARAKPVAISVSIIIVPVTSLWKRHLFRKRLAAIPELLISDLESMASALRAGSSFIQAVQTTAQTQEGPLAEEWQLVLNDIHQGASLSQALRHLETRLPIVAVQSLVSAVTIIQETGGNLAGVLLTLSQSLRQEIIFQGKLRSMTAQGRLSGYIVSGMPLLILIALQCMTPDLIRPLFVTPQGWMMLLTVIVMVSIGGFLIKKIVTIDV